MEDVYRNFEIPLINRFEKHIITQMDTLSSELKAIVHKISSWVQSFCQQLEGTKQYQPEECFVGYSENVI